MPGSPRGSTYVETRGPRDAPQASHTDMQSHPRQPHRSSARSETRAGCDNPRRPCTKPHTHANHAPTMLCSYRWLRHSPMYTTHRHTLMHPHTLMYPHALMHTYSCTHTRSCIFMNPHTLMHSHRHTHAPTGTHSCTYRHSCNHRYTRTLTQGILFALRHTFVSMHPRHHPLPVSSPGVPVTVMGLSEGMLSVTWPHSAEPAWCCPKGPELVGTLTCLDTGAHGRPTPLSPGQRVAAGWDAGGLRGGVPSASPTVSCPLLQLEQCTEKQSGPAV